MPDNNYATKQDLQELRTHVDERLDKVLRAFQNWAKPAEVKFRSHEERLALLEERISNIELSNIERRHGLS